VVLKLSDVLPQ
jgi:Holliday junction resolvasome RuvABC endonuclease subunit